jgi:hypothetical protein
LRSVNNTSSCLVINRPPYLGHTIPTRTVRLRFTPWIWRRLV